MWNKENIAGQLAEIATAREKMEKRWGDQHALPLERHLSFAVEGLGKVAGAVNDVTHHKDRLGKWTSDKQTIAQLESIKELAWQTAANLVQLVEAVKAREASL